MIIDIDWSKAPEGATHYCVGSVDNTHWRDLSGETARYWFGGRWNDQGLSAHCLASNVRYIARPAWNGEGLPPVGTVCEWHPNQDGWVVVEILGHNGEETWFRREDHTSSETCLRMAFFRPIRTAEQIKADERESGIRKIQIDHGVRARDGGRVIAEKLWDMGYRKQVAP